MKNKKRFLPALFAALSCFGNSTSAAEKPKGWSTGTLIATNAFSTIIGGGIGALGFDECTLKNRQGAERTIEDQKSEIKELKMKNKSLENDLDKKNNKLDEEKKYQNTRYKELYNKYYKLLEENASLQSAIENLSKGKEIDESAKLFLENKKYKPLFEVLKNDVFYDAFVQPKEKKGIDLALVKGDCVEALQQVSNTENQIALNCTMNLVCSVYKTVRILECIEQYITKNDVKYLNKIEEVKKFFNRSLVPNHSIDEMNAVLNYEPLK